MQQRAIGVTPAISCGLNYPKWCSPFFLHTFIHCCSKCSHHYRDRLTAKWPWQNNNIVSYFWIGGNVLDYLVYAIWIIDRIIRFIVTGESFVKRNNIELRQYIRGRGRQEGREEEEEIRSRRKVRVSWSTQDWTRSKVIDSPGTVCQRRYGLHQMFCEYLRDYYRYIPSWLPYMYFQWKMIWLYIFLSSIQLRTTV